MCLLYMRRQKYSTLITAPLFHFDNSISRSVGNCLHVAGIVAAIKGPAEAHDHGPNRGLNASSGSRIVVNV